MPSLLFGKKGNSIDDCSSAITLQVESVRREDVLRDLRRKFDGLLYELKLSEEHVINIDDS
jgi:hypothetical protein